MPNDYFTHSTPLVAGTPAKAADVNSLFDAIETGLDKLPSEAEMAAGLVTYLTLAGGTTTYTAAYTGYSAYTAGDSFQLKVNATNTGASTLNIESQGAVAIKNADLTDLLAGDLLINSVVTVTYNGTVFVLQSNSANAASSAAAAATSEANAAASEALANQWATEAEDVPVSGGEYSAYHWALKSQASANEVLSVNGQTGTVVLDWGTSGNIPETVTTDKTLTSSNSGYQIITGDYAITLPDATTLNKGAMRYQIENQHTTPIPIRNNSGSLILPLMASSTGLVNLITNSDANGTWSEALGNTLTAGYSGDAVSLDASTHKDYYAVKFLSDTTAIAIFEDVDVATKAYACLFTISGNTTISAGSVQYIDLGTATYFSMEVISATEVIVSYYVSGTGIVAQILTVSGSTITPGTRVVVDAAGTNASSIALLSTTRALITYEATSLGKARIVDISGSTVTAVGSATTISGSDNPYLRVLAEPVSSTRALVAYILASGSDSKVLTVDVSGTTITPNTAYTLDNSSTSQQGLGFVKLSSTTFVATYYRSGGQAIKAMTLSGTVVTVGTVTAFDDEEVNWPALARISDTQCVVGGRNGTGTLYMLLKKVTVSGTDITLGSEFYATDYRTDQPSIDYSNNKIICVAKNATGDTYGKAIISELI